MLIMVRQVVTGRRWGAILLAVFVVVCLGGFLLARQFGSVEESLLNITELSEEFMDNFFTEYGSITSEEDKENVLIVTATKEITNNHGASRVVVAPNHQYILLYGSEAAKNAAREKFEDDGNIVAVDDNDVITLDGTEYNSWGIEEMALDGVIEAVEGRDLPEVRVAVIDSGCDVDLVNKYYPGKIAETYNVLSKSTDDMYDNYGHGTHIAGVIAEGTPSNVKVVPMKVGDSRTMRITDVIVAIDYVVYHEMADVINMSFGLYKYNTALYDAIEAANQAKIVNVAAAGNDNTSEKAYPAAYDNTISIASVDSGLGKSSFSNYNTMVDFAAPGTGIKSTLSSNMALSKGTDGDDDFEVLNGTSMAAPHVASAVAVLKSYNKSLTKDETVGLLTEYATKDLGEVGRDVYYGNGFIALRPEAFCANGETDECEEFGVFKTAARTTVVGFGVRNGLLTDRNYGTVNNLNPTQVEVTYSDGVVLAASLGDLRGVEIFGYDAEAKGEQTVEVEWQGQRTEFRVVNPSEWESGWKYVVTGERTAKLTGFVDFGSGNTKRLYLPEKIGQYEINELAGATEGYTVFDYANKTTYEEVVLPKTLVEISGSQAFRGFSALKRVITQAPVLKITGNNVFGDNGSLAEVDGPIELVGGSTFIGATALRKVTLADDMTEVPANSFNGCSALERIILPSRLEKIGDFAFYGAGIMEIDLPESLVKMGEYVFANTNLEKIYVPSGVEEIGTGAFVKGGNYITVWTDTEAYAKRYAVENEVPYEATNVAYVDLALEEREFKSFDKVETKVYLYFDRGVDEDGYKELKGVDGRREVIEAENVEVVYPDGRESFRHGDEWFGVRGTTQYGERFEKTFAVTVAKKEIGLQSADYEDIYDGGEHSIKIEVGLENYEIRYAVNDTDYNLTELPMFTEVGEYTVNYKVSAEGYDDAEGSNKVKIYGVKDFGESVVLKDDKLVVRDNDFDALWGGIATYAASSEYEHYNKYHEVTTGVLKTGDIIKVTLNGAEVYEWRVALVGDTNGDGKVSYLDYVNVYNHIQKVKNPGLNKVLLADEYLLAADVSGDGKVNYLDYVKVYNKIKEQKGKN